MKRTRGLVNDLSTSLDSVRTLQRALYVKAKAEPAFRCYSLWDKIYRPDVVAKAYRRCRANGGSAGIDGETFARIEQAGSAQWLVQLGQELRLGEYRPQPLRRVWIPKANGQRRPLSIPCIRDRVAQMATMMVLQPIFESDFLPQQYGFRPRLDAKMGVRRVYFHLTQHHRTEVVDADLKDYFNTIPHGDLLKSVSRRVADGRVLKHLKAWLSVPVMEETPEGRKLTSPKHRGVPQGGPCSPLLSTIYFRRFLLGWEQQGWPDRLDAAIVNYADDLVICCRPGQGRQALTAMTKLMERLGLTVNEEKTQVVSLPEQALDFLGYTFCRQYNRHGRAFIGTKPSKKSVKRLTQTVHALTARTTTLKSTAETVAKLNQVMGGWATYFNQGPVLQTYEQIQRYTDRRLRRWLLHKHKQQGTGYRQYPDQYLYEELGLIKLPTRRTDLPSVKA